MDDNIFNLIVAAQQHKGEALEKLLHQFTPLLKKYARMLQYEDAFYDLQADFIGLITTLHIENMQHKEDKFLVSYFKNTVYSDYVRISKIYKRYRQTHLLECDMSPDEFANIDIIAVTYDNYDSLLLNDLQHILNRKEFEVIYLCYFLNLTPNRVALLKRVSCQAVNKARRHAIDKLKKELLS
ncbi:sigma-70 family RNA polymerase sigma factor [Acetanaerobacterium elongatum]|uniref:RNA polymerase sigma factor, sigma-70 family n=1 Tax=Acetanaerobacterium elongatum TaxID=258515 RepID=A0A1H0H547_9FIRM|nr:sigma-70 family RNA polymerase sigma factor [Acetanaerobacterium elongatum]SDO14210.1 hypothetical protein SAMN05192585_1619 [Acetanaerobacterium elongatum]